MTSEEGEIGATLARLAEAQPAAPVLQVRGRACLTYGGLGEQLRYVRGRLGEWGFDRGDVIAGFVASRPDMALACATFASASTFAPLGGSLPRTGYADLLRRLRPKAVLVPSEEAHPLIAAANDLGLAMIRLSAGPEGPAGRFTLEFSRPSTEGLAPARVPRSYAYVMASSGTTGRAKLVPLEHEQLLHHTQVMGDWLRFTPDDVTCNLVPLHLSHGLRNGLMTPLLSGHSVVCLAESDVDGFLLAFDDFQPTYLTAVFTIYRELLTRAHGHRERLARGRLRFLRIGAGRLEPEEIDRIEQAFGAPALKGLTLSEGAAAQDPLPPRRRKRDALGLPLAELAIMVEPGRFAPAGASGEIVLRGPLIFPGYLDDPELTAQSFIDGWFRTGDLGRVDEDGYVYHLGRIKELINRGGEKFSPLQIDAALESLAGVKEAAAFGVPHPRLGEEVVAAVVRDATASIDERQVIEHARRRVGLAGAPRRVYFVDRLPRNEAGKVRRAELARLAGVDVDGALPSSADAREPDVPTRSPLETAVGALFGSILRRDDIGPGDDFFLCGGDSLSGARLLAQVQAVFGVDLPIRALFGEAATVSGMAQMIERLRHDGAMTGATTREASSPSLRHGQGPTVLSHTQRRMWFLAKLDPANPAYNEVRVYRLTGPLEATALRESLRAVVRRHEVLRTTYRTIDGEPKQIVDHDGNGPELQLVDLSRAGDRHAALDELIVSLTETPFDLEAGPVARFALARLGDSEHVFVRVWHHIAGDGWSAAILERELAAAYNSIVAGRPLSLVAPRMRYCDFAVWQAERSRSDGVQRQIEYWKAKLSSVPTLRLPTDRPRPAIQSYRGARVERTIPKAMVDELAEIGRSAGATPFITLLSAFLVLLHRYSDEEDIAVGTPIAGRTRSEFEGLIGFFANTLVLRVDVSAEPTFPELLRRVRETALDAYEHQEVPFEKLVEEVAPVRDSSRNPLFQVCFALQSGPSSEMTLDGVEVHRATPPTTHAKFDVTLTLRPAAHGMEAFWEYCADLFDKATIERMAGHYERLLEAISENPQQSIGRIPMLSRAERQALLGWGAASTKQPLNPS